MCMVQTYDTRHAAYPHLYAPYPTCKGSDGSLCRCWRDGATDTFFRSAPRGQPETATVCLGMRRLMFGSTSNVHGFLFFLSFCVGTATNRENATHTGNQSSARGGPLPPVSTLLFCHFCQVYEGTIPRGSRIKKKRWWHPLVGQDPQPDKSQWHQRRRGWPPA